MPQNHRLQFSVEESICFQKGQEVSELLSISLDPDIRVQEVNDYVSIRGSLELTGEYNIDQSRDFEELITEKRFVEEVRTREDGTAELTHCFPVDITIPKNKVSHLNDVFVFIDAFDYQLSESRLLTIQADLAIEGLLDENEIRQPEAPLYATPGFLQGKDEDNHTSESPSLNNREPETDENQAEDSAPPAPEAVLRQESEEAEENAAEDLASLAPEAGLHLESEEAAPPVPEAELRQEAEAEKQAGEITAAPPVPETALRQEPEEKAEEKAAEVYSSPLPETVLSQEAEEEASVAKISAPPLPEAALRQESKEEAEAAAPPASEPVFHQEEKKEFEPLLRVGTKKRSEEKTDSECEPSLHAEQEPSDEAGENSFAENQSLTEEPEVDLTPAYRAFLPEHEPEEHSLYSAPKLLEESEEEREEAGFEIEVRKTSSAEKADEEFHPEFSFQLSHTPESGSKEPAAHTKRAPTAETEEPQARENNNSLYLTKLFTREEEEFSRMKICIVQQQDTIDRVCERYDISSQQLIRMNALSLDAELEEGQILYIPEYNNSHA